MGQRAEVRADIFRDLAERGIQLQMVNLGGGFPTRYLQERAGGEATYGNAIFRALSKHFGNRIPETIIEPGRGMVGNAGRDRGGSRADLEEVGGATAKFAGSISTSASSTDSPRRPTR